MMSKGCRHAREAGSTGAVERWARLARVQSLLQAIPGAFWPNQYANRGNSDAQRNTMREIAAALGEVDFVFCATSTCGTIRGCCEYVRELGLRTRVVAVDAVGSRIFGCEPARRLIPGLGAGLTPELCEPAWIERCVWVSDLDCIVGCRRLVQREAILAGGSSGGVATAVERMRDADDLPVLGHAVLELACAGEGGHARRCFGAEARPPASPGVAAQCGDGRRRAAPATVVTGEEVVSLPGRRLDDVFTARASATPERVAVSTVDQDVTYGQLNARAERVARRLKSLGVGPDVLVGLCVDRSVEMIVGLLGIVKAGGAYVPIDPDYPAKRVRFLIEDSAVPVVVAVPRVAEALRECAAATVWVDGDEPEAAPGTPRQVAAGERDLAYVIYTSGSTGTPKGVLIEQHSVLRLFEQTQAWFQFDERDVWTVFHSIGFDFSVWEIWGALLYGGRMLIVPAEARRSPDLMHALLREQRVTVLNQTPSAFRQLLTALPPGRSSDLALRYVIFGGERLDLRLLGPWIERYGDEQPQLVNMYGITETTVHVTYRRVRQGDLARAELSPIGVPIPDLQVQLWDASGQAVPDGTPGEMYVAGPGLARGYLNRPELTAERFVQRDPGDGQGPRRYYRSGDRALRLADGQLAYLGRADDQIKVRGFRIEPREIELCLAAEPGVGTAIVAARDYGEGDVRLVAYVVPRAGSELTDELAEALTAGLLRRARAELPPHMRPSAYHVVASVPTTAHGKADLEELHSRVEPPRASAGAAQAPLTATQQLILQIARDILECPGLGIHDDLFEHGATSLAWTRILLRVNQRLGVALPAIGLPELSVAGLAAAADAQLEGGAGSAPPESRARSAR